MARGVAASVVGAIGLALTASVEQAPAQPLTLTQPSTEAAREAAKEMSLPSGVGGCVMHAMDADVRQAVLAKLAGGARGVPPELAPAVAKVSAGCTGRPYASSDSALVAAVLGAFQRTGGAIFFAAYLGIGQHRLDAVWREATPEEKQPFLQAAKNFLDPKSPPSAPTPGQTEPFARRLKIDVAGDPRMLSPVQLYYMATAFGEAGEARLAEQGAKPARP